jgi:hypothetical protein
MLIPVDRDLVEVRRIPLARRAGAMIDDPHATGFAPVPQGSRDYQTRFTEPRSPRPCCSSLLGTLREDADTGERARFRSSIVPCAAALAPKVDEVLPLVYLHGMWTGKALGTRAAGLAMAFKLIESAQQRWRAVDRTEPLCPRPRCRATQRSGSGRHASMEENRSPVLTIPRLRHHSRRACQITGRCGHAVFHGTR